MPSGNLTCCLGFGIESTTTEVRLSEPSEPCEPLGHLKTFAHDICLVLNLLTYLVFLHHMLYLISYIVTGIGRAEETSTYSWSRFVP